MNKFNKRWFIGFLLLMLFSLSFIQPQVSPTVPGASRVQQAQSPANKVAIDSLASLPLTFVPNVGQFDPQVRYVAHGSGYTLFLTDQEAVLSVANRVASQNSSPSALVRAQGPTSSPENQVIRYQWRDANATTSLIAENKLAGSSNYFIGNDHTKWHTNVPNYGRVTYQALYPGVDLSYYGNAGKMEYDFTVAPGADPSRIRLAITGAKVEAVAGELVLHTTAGDLRQPAPHIYQDGPNGRRDVAGSYTLTADGEIGFRLTAYDTMRPLVIDPVVDYATYLGGDGWFDSAMAVKADAQGNAYVVGYTDSDNFPVYHSIQPFRPGYDAFISKLAPDGASFIYSTYLGGGGELGQGIAVDSSGNVYVAGSTQSADFPLVNPIQSSLRGSQNLFMSKLNAAGDQLLYSTYFGGNVYDYSGGVALDGANNAFFTGMTESSNFPLMNPIQSSLEGNTDSFIVKLSPNGALVFSTYLGGNYDDGSGGGGSTSSTIATDSAGNVYITGGTGSTNFPTVNPLQGSLNGTSDAFITKVSGDGQHILYSTYLGGTDTDGGEGIAVGSDGSIYVTGETSSLNFPLVNPVQGLYAGGNDDAFVAKLNPAGTALTYSTFLGGSNGDVGQSIVVDSEGNATVVGKTDSSDYPTYDPLPGRSQLNTEGFATKLNNTGNAFIYSTGLGGEYGTTNMGVALDANGNTYITGMTFSTDFATTPVVQATKVNGDDAFVAKLNPASATPSATVTGTPPTATPIDTPIPTPPPSGSCPNGTQRLELVNDNVETIPDSTLIRYGPWQAASDSYHSPTHSWESSFGYYGRLYSLLTHDILPIPSNTLSATLSFWHEYSFLHNVESGGVIEYSADNGANWHDLGATIVQNGYNGTISEGPLAGRSAFVGTSTGYPNYEQTVVNLDALAGRSVRIRFALVNYDYPQTSQGWNIDDVEIYACTNGTPVPTNTPGGPTNTPEPSNTPILTNTPEPSNTPAVTNTPTPPPTDCPNVFTDITGNVFYGAIHYLNCRGVVNGTDATHFSPSGTSTRAQFAKVVVLGFGTPFYTPTSPDFSDVPATNFAYLYIESGFHAGILSGFDAQSCTTHGATFPCYLPSLAITRAQLTKLVVNAGGYLLRTVTATPNGGLQDFQDVPPTHPFYSSIETAYYYGIIHGYPCGQPPAGVCVPSRNLPYFLPDNSIRRDEMAQIVYKGILSMP